MCRQGSLPTGPADSPTGLIPIIVDCGSTTCKTSTFYVDPNKPKK